MTDAERLKAYDDELSAEMPADLKDWWRNSRDEWPLVARLVLQNRRERLEECYAEIERLRLTDEEREAIEVAVAYLEKRGVRNTAVQETLRGLLARTK
jgi:hypothetical protein